MKTKKILAIVIILTMIMSNCFALLSNIVYAAETTYTVTFAEANPGNESYQYGAYNVINWCYTIQGIDEQGNPTTFDNRLYARIQKYDTKRREWLNVEGIFAEDNGNQVATFTSEAEDVNTEYRVVLDNFLNDYNIFVNGQKITMSDYTIENPNGDEYSQVILNRITDGMSISVDEKEPERCIEFSGSTWKNNNTITYTVNETVVDVQIGKINNENFEPIDLIDNSSENQETHEIDNHYEAHFEESHAGYYLKLSGFNSENMDLIINGNPVEVTEGGYVDLCFLDNDGYTRSWISIYNKGSISPVNPTGERSIEIRGAVLDPDDTNNTTGMYTIGEKQVKVQLGIRYAPQGDEGYTFEPVEFGVLAGPRLEARVEDESGQFSGYFLKIENPDNAEFELWVDGFLENENIVEGEWFSIAGRTQSPLNIEIAGEGIEPIGTIFTVVFDVDGGSNVQIQSISEGNTATRPEEPTKEGYIFDDWYTNTEFTQRFDFDTPITDNLTLYAHWVEDVPEPTFRVEYDFNGGTRHGESVYITSSVGFVPVISVDNFIDWMEVDPPEGKELDAIEINGVRYELGTYYELNRDTIYRYIWKDTVHVHTLVSVAGAQETCTTPGNKPYYKCSGCGEWFIDSEGQNLISNHSEVVIPAKGHAAKETTTTKVTKATLSKNGQINKSIETKCSVCGESLAGRGETTTIYYPKTISLSKTAFTYNGKVQKPTVTVKDSKGKVIAASNYTVTYSNKSSKKVGEYTVTITFKGNYSGTKKLTYKINPKGTSLSKLTKGSKQFKATWKAQKTETTGYEVQYATNNKFTSGKKTVNIKKNKTTSTTVKKLKNKKKYYVRIRTYKTVNGKKYYSGWSKVLNVKTK